MDFTRAFELVDAKQARTLERLRQIVGVNTVVPPGLNYDVLVDYLEPQFQAAGFKTTRVTVPPETVALIPLPLSGPRINLVASRETGKHEAVTIYAHMDVVPIEEDWIHDPFAGELDNGRIYGRGAADMKGTIASLLTALEVMHELNIEPRYDIHCIVCTDEEIGVYPGAKYLAELGYVKGHILCMEGTQDPRVHLSSAGDVDVTITTIGKSCHSGSNYLGVNAIEAMVPVLNELLALKRVVEIRESQSPAVPHPKAPSKFVTPMFNLDIIHAGIKSNIVPSACSLVVNRRYLPEEKYEDVVAEIRDAIERGRRQSVALDVRVEYMRAYPAARFAPDSAYAQRMREAFKRVQGYRDEDFVRAGGSGSTDMADIAEICRTDQFVRCGMGRQAESNAHGADESIRLSDLLAHTKELVWYLAE
jgi:succinyl-diaminopimelate desuccinylase